MKRFRIVNGKAVTTHTGQVTYWNGKPTPAKLVRVIVGKSPAGCAWEKVTTGRGSPRLGHRSLPVARVVGGPHVMHEAVSA